MICINPCVLALGWMSSFIVQYRYCNAYFVQYRYCNAYSAQVEKKTSTTEVTACMDDPTDIIMRLVNISWIYQLNGGRVFAYLSL